MTIDFMIHDLNPLVPVVPNVKKKRLHFNIKLINLHFVLLSFIEQTTKHRTTAVVFIWKQKMNSKQVYELVGLVFTSSCT